ncbi:MAG: hypothetical protein JXB49_23590, partial [Bacteroidales bacterium]|nr:hypothetical protein [Bacteroidales bacterium]
MLNRLIYFFYYLKRTDPKTYRKFLLYAHKSAARNCLQIITDSILSSFKFNNSLLDYFYFRFFEKNKEERRRWAGTGYMYEYQRIMNPVSSRDVLADKAKFLDQYAKFIRRKHRDISKSSDQRQAISVLLTGPTGKLVLKNALGQVGAEVEVINCKDFTPESLIGYMRKKKFNLIEEFVIQHPELMELSPSGLNTIRIITQINQEGKVDFLGARLRISVNSHVDNMAAGNMAASIDIESGIVNGSGVYSDITKEDEIIHPVSGKKIQGFKIPFWTEALELAKEAALHQPANKSVGWDIAVTGTGVELIEGNHNWCKL